MTQTDDGFSASDALVEVSTDGITYTDISGSSASVKPGSQVRTSGGKFTHSGDLPILASAKRQPTEAEITIIYTEGAGDPFEAVRVPYEAKDPLWVRWTPKGADVDNVHFMAEEAIITGLNYPETDTESPDPEIFSFSIWSKNIHDYRLERMLLEDGSGHWLFEDDSVMCFG